MISKSFNEFNRYFGALFSYVPITFARTIFTFIFFLLHHRLHYFQITNKNYKYCVKYQILIIRFYVFCYTSKHASTRMALRGVLLKWRNESSQQQDHYGKMNEKGAAASFGFLFLFILLVISTSSFSFLRYLQEIAVLGLITFYVEVLRGSHFFILICILKNYYKLR